MPLSQSCGGGPKNSNVKLSTVAEKLVAELPDLLNGYPAMRAPVDHYLLTLTPPKK
jgi:hypothetical protein